jgi:hypothetical protein
MLTLIQKHFRWPLALLVALALASPAHAWNDTGHRLIASIAWADLSPAARTRFTDILKQHPRYKQDLLADLPDGMSPAQTDAYAFGIAATWPDVVRAFANPMHAAYNHPNWHYIDIPYSVAGQLAKFPPPNPDTPPGPQNALEAIAFNIAAFKNPANSPKDQAIALCWILHLYGDIHQPLHAVELFSPQFPSGDQGGNSIQVIRTPPYADTQINLHALWDQLPGVYKDARDIDDLAAGLRIDPRYTRTALKDALAVTDPTAWAKESHDLAITSAYLNGQLPGIAPSTQPATTAPADAHPLPPGYLEQAEQTAMLRVVLAGYRTADFLNALSDNK